MTAPARFWNPFNLDDPSTHPDLEQDVLVLEGGEISASTVWTAVWEGDDFYGYDTDGDFTPLIGDLDLEITHWAAIPPLD